MDKTSKSKSAIISSAARRLAAASGEAITEDKNNLIWVRGDGALCVGDECIVIKQEPGTKNLDIDIAPSKCGEETAEVLLNTILKTIGKGGNTRFTVKSDFVDDSK